MRIPDVMQFESKCIFWGKKFANLAVLVDNVFTIQHAIQKFVRCLAAYDFCIYIYIYIYIYIHLMKSK